LYILTVAIPDHGTDAYLTSDLRNDKPGDWQPLIKELTSWLALKLNRGGYSKPGREV